MDMRYLDNFLHGMILENYLIFVNKGNGDNGLMLCAAPQVPDLAGGGQERSHRRGGETHRSRGPRGQGNIHRQSRRVDPEDKVTPIDRAGG